MKLHTRLRNPEIAACMIRAKQAGHMAADIEFTQFAHENSRSHWRGMLIQLGTTDRFSRPGPGSRKFKNSGSLGAGSLYAATRDEWGWFIAEVFAADPDAVFGPYRSPEDFREKTGNAFILPVGDALGAHSCCCCAGKT